MKRLQVLIDKQWQFVFCHIQGKVITTKDQSKALPSKACWANDDLSWFASRFSNLQFKLTNLSGAGKESVG